MSTILSKYLRLFVALGLASTCALAQAQSRCNEVSAEAKANGNKILVIAFEGLGQYYEGGINQLYQYQENKRGSLPQLGGWGDLITAGLLAPMVRKFGHKFEVAVFSSYSSSEGESCALTWLAGGGGRKVILVGHSAGGPTATSVAATLVGAGHSVDAVFTLDSVGIESSRPSHGIAFWGNFYERGGGIPGSSIESADINKNVSSEAGHMNLPAAPSVVRAVEARMALDIGSGGAKPVASRPSSKLTSR